jgi:hypothetical protein
MNVNYLFDGTLGTFNIEPSSLQLMDPNCKPILARTYTVLRSVEQQLQQTQHIFEMLHVTHSYSKDWGSGLDPSNGRVTFASAMDLNMGYYHIKLVHDADAQKICTIVFPWHMGKYKYKR